MVSARQAGQLNRLRGWRRAVASPGQEFGDGPRRMISDASEQVGEILLRVVTVELGALDQGVDRSGAAAAGIGASEEIIFSAYGNTAQSALGGIVVERKASVVEAAHQGGPARP